jgi:HEAT repeat protein
MRSVRIVCLLACIAAPANAQQDTTHVLHQAHRHLQAMAHVLHGQTAELQRLHTHLRSLTLQHGAGTLDSLHTHLAAQGAHLAQLHATLGDVLAWQHQLNDIAPAPLMLDAQDPADSLWRAAHDRLSRAEFTRASADFHAIRTEDRFEQSGYRPHAYYWEAFSLARTPSQDNLRAARELLVQMRQRYPSMESLRDAETLLTAIDGRLAAGGDEAAARATTNRATSRLAQCPSPLEQDVRLTALTALVQMDPAGALPALRGIMSQHDACVAPLRRRALMLIGHMHVPEAAQMLNEIARNDPDPDVVRQATLLLARTSSEETVSALEHVLRTRREPEVQQDALIALTHHQQSPRATEVLRQYAADESEPLDTRMHAVMGLAQSAETAGFLHELYPDVSDPRLREQIVLAVGHHGRITDAAWLMDVALDQSEPLALRKQALFVAGRHSNVPVSRLDQLYERLNDVEIRTQIIFTLARREETAAVDALMRIAGTETDVELRRHAVYWLGQSRDPRVPAFLRDIVR